jgi:hypothetical protein
VAIGIAGLRAGIASDFETGIVGAANFVGAATFATGDSTCTVGWPGALAWR